jgi:hypothetical protein
MCIKYILNIQGINTRCFQRELENRGKGMGGLLIVCLFEFKTM